VNALADPRRRAILRLVRDVERPSGEIAAAGVGPLVLNHIGTETGEIACLKGLQGARGYPF
jgi:hypothetical protein